MKIIIFDTETTGMPQFGQPLDRQPYVCQFAAIIYEYDAVAKTFQPIKKIDQLIKPPIPMPLDCVHIHGITDQKLMNEPVFADFVDEMLDFFKEADLAIAHNLPFDVAIIEIELDRLKKSKNFLPAQTYDTMKETKELCRLSGKNGNYKSPRLTELHQFLLGEAFQNAHNAIADVEALGRCVKKLIGHGFFKPVASNQVSASNYEQSSLF